MPTEITPSALNLSIEMEEEGRPLNNGLYKQTSDQKFHYGKRIITFDGRIFKYGGSKTALLSGFGAANYTSAANIIGAVLPAAVAVSDRIVTVTIASGDGYAGDGVVAKNELVGAYVVMGHGESLVQNRVIVANDAVASGGGTTKITLDGAIEQIMTASSSYCEIQLNPYKYLGKGALEYNAFMCVPSQNVTSGYNFFGQTWGPCWITPGGADATPGDSANDRTVYFVGDGSVNGGTALTVESGYQKAGFIIDSTANGTGALPLVMLQLSV